MCANTYIVSDRTTSPCCRVTSTASVVWSAVHSMRALHCAQKCTFKLARKSKSRFRRVALFYLKCNCFVCNKHIMYTQHTTRACVLANANRFQSFVHLHSDDLLDLVLHLVM